MKQLLTSCICIFAIPIMISSNYPGNNTIAIDSKDVKLTDWEWTSGDVELHKTASKQSFSLNFSPAVYHARDSIKITFTSYKIAMNNMSQGALYDSWSGLVNFDYYLNATWAPLISDTNALINRPIGGKRNNTIINLNKVIIRTAVPLSHTLTLTTSSVSFNMNNEKGNPVFTGGKVVVTYNATIHGIEIEKIEPGK